MKKKHYEEPEWEVEWDAADVMTLSTEMGNEDEEIGGGGNPWAE